MGVSSRPDSNLHLLTVINHQPSTMPNIKLTYFNGKGRGETARLILAYGGMHYEDRRVSFEDMPSLKPSLPFGQLPVLEVDGNTICQSMAIARYLASECGIAGSSGLVKAQVDEVVDVINDVQNAMYGAFFEKDEKMKKVGEETIPKNMANLEKVLEKRGGQFFAGNCLTWAELHFLQLVDLMSTQNPKCLEATPELASLVERTRKVPNIKKWLEDRPSTEF